MNRKGKRRKEILLIPACIIAAGFLINQITVCPFIWAFRGIMSLAGRQGNPGSYTDAMARAEEVGHVTVSVGGYVIWLLGGDVRGSVASETFATLARTLRALAPGQLIGFHPFGRCSSSQWFAGAA